MKVDLAGALRRRWYVVLIGLLITPALCFGATRLVGETYEAKAMLVLLPPGASIPKAGNPYLNLGSMQPVVGVLSDSMLSQQTARSVRDVSPTASFTVAPDPATSGAVLIIDVKDTTSAGAARVLKMLTSSAPQELEKLQDAAKTPAKGRITTDLVAQDTKPVASHKKQQRAGLLIAAMGIALTVLVAAFVDGFASRRSRRRGADSSRGARHASESAEIESVEIDDVPTSGVADAASTPEPGREARGEREHPSDSDGFNLEDDRDAALAEFDMQRLSPRG
ncbi:hypothetical protein [Flexivirga sp. B27]